jgi:hypothetical protein
VQVYYISKGTVKPSNAQFSGGVKHEFQIYIEPNTQVRFFFVSIRLSYSDRFVQIIPVEEDATIPSAHYSFIPIADLENMPAGQLVGTFSAACFLRARARRSLI